MLLSNLAVGLFKCKTFFERLLLVYVEHSLKANTSECEYTPNVQHSLITDIHMLLDMHIQILIHIDIV